MKRQLFSLAICLLLFAGLFSFYTNNVKSASGDGIVEVELNVRGTFLRAMDDWPYAGPGEGAYDEELEMWVGTHTDFRVEEATMIDLQDEGFIEGDKIYISWLGGFYPDGAWNPSNPGSIGYGLKENDAVSHGGLLGLFSTSSQLLDIDQLNRVPGAIDYGSNDYITPDTWWKDGRAEVAEKLASKGIDWYTGALETDIPEDFKISPHTGMKVEIPRNARFLFLSLIDPYYRDNYESPNGLIVTIEKDTDEDGIPDNWEINGIDTDKDGIIDLDLPMLGADWEHKDIFLEIDYMVGCKPDQNAINDVVKAFAQAPVTNPDNIDGINLHVFYGDEVPYKDMLSSWTEFYSYKSNYFGTADEAKPKVYRYCLSVNRIWLNPPDYDCPGLAEGIPCDDFILAFGGLHSRSRSKEAAIFMHELGHTLGLKHGGGDDVNFKPNYLSVMNYAFEFADYVPDRPLDYSWNPLPTIDEESLNEHAGIDTETKTVWMGPDGNIKRSDETLAIDWNDDGNITAGVQVNLNNFPDEPSSKLEPLVGYNDWDNLIYRFRGTKLFAASSKSDDYHMELTGEAIERRAEEAKNIIEVTVPDSYVPSINVRTFGLEDGDWFEYSVSWTGGEPESYYAVNFKGEVVSVTDEIIEIQWESENVGGQTHTYSETYNINLGSHDFWVIPANSEIGDLLVNEEWGTIDVDGVEYYGYAGSERTVLWAVEDFATMHWDKETGLIVQHDCDYTGLHRRLLLERTNVWGTETSGLDPLFVIALVLIVAGILLILLLLFRRKKKKDKKQASDIAK